jgi:type II secretory ATPase GspE/PulE/Tfp pilus assembly ATPase PilB-like protein
VLCPACREKIANPEAVLEKLPVPLPEGCLHELWHPVGCEKCKGSGYRGRLSIVEFVTLDDDYYQAILEGNDPVKLRQIAANKGMRTMFLDGLIKATRGQTTLEEVYRVTSH